MNILDGKRMQIEGFQNLVNKLLFESHSRISNSKLHRVDMPNITGIVEDRLSAMHEYWITSENKNKRSAVREFVEHASIGLINSVLIPQIEEILRGRTQNRQIDVFLAVKVRFDFIYDKIIKKFDIRPDTLTKQKLEIIGKILGLYREWTQLYTALVKLQERYIYTPEYPMLTK